MTKITISREDTTGKETLWEGEYETRTEAARSETLYVNYLDDDAYPLLLCSEDEQTIRELSGKEADILQEKGVVVHIKHAHPRASRNGHPVCAINIPEVWAATCGNLGFIPSPRLELFCEDSEDDSPGNFLLKILVPEQVKAQIEAVTKEAITALKIELQISEMEAGGRLRQITDRLATITEVEIVEQLEEKNRAFEKSRGRGVELAEDIDDLRGFLEARKKINGPEPA